MPRRSTVRLTKMFNLAVEQEHRATNPCKGIKKFHEDQRWRNFSDDEVARNGIALARPGSGM